MNSIFYRLIKVGASGLLLSLTQTVWAKKSNELVYTEPFDLAAGGTTLTRSSQEGIVFANPALLPLGGAWVRWVGLQTGVMVDRELAENARKGSLGSAAGSGQSDYIDQLLSKSVHFGQSLTLSFLNKNVAVSVFDRIEVDLAGEKFGDYGLPVIKLEIEAYAGILTSYAWRPARWLTLGMTAKQLYVSEPSIALPVADQEKIKQITEDTSSLRSSMTVNKGSGTDLGALLFAQGRTVDFSLGLKVDDLGGTRFTGEQQAFPQSYHAGLGVAIHGTKEVVHLSLDYRDIGNAYQEASFKKIYLGSRFMLRNSFGLACGLYQGIPTVGMRLDLLLFKLGMTAYGRELGKVPGDRQRNMVLVYTSLGF